VEPPRQLNDHLKAELHAALAEAGWKLQTRSPSPRSNANYQVDDHLIASGKERYLVQLEIAPRPMRSVMEAALARAALVAMKVAQAHKARPLAVVGAEFISRRMAESLHEFARNYLDENVAFGWLDARGTLELHGSSTLAVVRVKRQPKKSATAKPAARTLTVFSDLGQWLLKVLLAPRFPLSLLSAPRVELDNVRHLAEVARVSVPTAHRLVTAAKDAGLLTYGRGHLSIVDPPGLFERWRRETAATTGDLHATWMLKKSNSSAALKKRLANKTESDSEGRPTACLGLFAAADLLGLGFVDGVPPHLLVRRMSAKVLEDFGLREADPGETVDVFVRQPAFPESTFRGAVRLGDVWVSDVIQTWLDTAHHRARGEEQAEFIHRRTLAPACSEGEE